MALREVAEALDVTPAYCLSIASFYDMLHIAPVGRHMVEVCTNVSCALYGAQAVIEAFQDELGCRAGETTSDGAITLPAEPRTMPGWLDVAARDRYVPGYEPEIAAPSGPRAFRIDGSSSRRPRTFTSRCMTSPSSSTGSTPASPCRSRHGPRRMGTRLRTTT